MINIVNHNIIISINASKGDCKPKNKIDHKILKKSWIPKTNTAFFTLLFCNPLLHIIYREIPIKTNNVVQTGAKIQLGGLKEGFWMPAYHPGIEGFVKIDPINPADKHINIEIVSFTMFIYFILTNNGAKTKTDS